jgi:hypothetical protein
LEQNCPLDGKYFIIRHAESFYNLACNNEKAGTNRGPHPEVDPKPQNPKTPKPHILEIY